MKRWETRRPLLLSLPLIQSDVESEVSKSNNAAMSSRQRGALRDLEMDWDMYGGSGSPRGGSPRGGSPRGSGGSPWGSGKGNSNKAVASPKSSLSGSPLGPSPATPQQKQEQGGLANPVYIAIDVMSSPGSPGGEGGGATPASKRKKSKSRKKKLSVSWIPPTASSRKRPKSKAFALARPPDLFWNACSKRMSMPMCHPN